MPPCVGSTQGQSPWSVAERPDAFRPDDVDWTVDGVPERGDYVAVVIDAGSVEVGQTVSGLIGDDLVEFDNGFGRDRGDVVADPFVLLAEADGAVVTALTVDAAVAVSRGGVLSHRDTSLCWVDAGG